MPKLLLDTNIVVDALQRRPINLADTELLLALGKVGEFGLWITTSQVTDLVYILSHGGKRSLLPQVLEQLQKLTTFVHVYEVTTADTAAMLATTWDDPEDALIAEAARQLAADAIITNNAEDFEIDAIKVLNSAEFFAWYAETAGKVYSQVAW